MTKMSSHVKPVGPSGNVYIKQLHRVSWLPHDFGLKKNSDLFNGTIFGNQFLLAGKSKNVLATEPPRGHMDLSFRLEGLKKDAVMREDFAEAACHRCCRCGHQNMPPKPCFKISSVYIYMYTSLFAKKNHITPKPRLNDSRRSKRKISRPSISCHSWPQTAAEFGSFFLVDLRHRS